MGAIREELDEAVAARMGRQRILDREHPPELWVIVDEAVLRRPVGGSGCDARTAGPPGRAVGGIGAASFLSDVGHEVVTTLLPSFLTSVLHAPLPPRWG